MTTSIVHPTVSLSPYVLGHSDDISFLPNEKLPSETRAVETRPVSRLVKRIHEADSLIANVAKVFAAVILAVSIVGIPLLYIWNRERKVLQENENIKQHVIGQLNTKNMQWNKRAEILENLKIENFADIPVLALGNERGATDYIDFLTPERLSHSIMKGIDCCDRPFISMKLKDKTNTFVVTFFQRFSDYHKWTWGSCDDLRVLDKAFNHASVLTPDSEKVLGAIIAGRHPTLGLA